MAVFKTILLVDDDLDDHWIFREAIDEINKEIKCSTALNGKEALQLMKLSPPPDIIFLDLNMPVMNGVEFLTTLKTSDKYKSIPVIIFSTSIQPRDIQKTKELGANLYFTKPFEYKKLVSKLEHFLRDGISESEYVL
jgi:CheY-like chemotaxis protein